jgi:hypothetical protein
MLPPKKQPFKNKGVGSKKLGRAKAHTKRKPQAKQPTPCSSHLLHPPLKPLAVLTLLKNLHQNQTKIIPVLHVEALSQLFGNRNLSPVEDAANDLLQSDHQQQKVTKSHQIQLKVTNCTNKNHKQNNSNQQRRLLFELIINS